MAPQVLRELLHQQPFVPFSVRLPDGEKIPVPTADHAYLVPSGRRFLVVSDDDRMRILDPILISEVETAAHSDAA